MSTPERRIGIVMAFIAATLVVGAYIHLAGLTPSGTKRPFNAGHAGVAEAIIAVVLAFGAFAVLRSTKQARGIAAATTGFAIVGFLVGLSMTARGGDGPDIIYHVVMLPVLVATFVWMSVRRDPGRHRRSDGPGRG